jgi:hypothetical protein
VLISGGDFHPFLKIADCSTDIGAHPGYLQWLELPHPGEVLKMPYSATVVVPDFQGSMQPAWSAL